MRQEDWKRLLAGLALTAPVPLVAHAEMYLTEDQAAAVLFPAVRLEARWIDLTAEDVRAIEKASGERVASSRVRWWAAPNGAAMIVDRVIGKHEFITYAVALGADGKVLGVEIMDYRETIGGDVRRPAWRKQFVGKSAADPVTLDRDIKNISGATLSSAHITDGVRRVISTYDVLKTKG